MTSRYTGIAVRYGSPGTVGVACWKPTQIIDSGQVIRNSRRYIYVTLNNSDVAKAIGEQYILLVQTQSGGNAELRMKLMSDPAVHISLERMPPQCNSIDVIDYLSSMGDVHLVDKVKSGGRLTST